MESVSVNKFRENLKSFADRACDRHEPLRITRRNGADLVIMSLDDWESEQETLYVLQDPYLMSQIRVAQATQDKKEGYRPNAEEMAEILAVADE